MPKPQVNEEIDHHDPNPITTDRSIDIGGKTENATAWMQPEVTGHAFQLQDRLLDLDPDDILYDAATDVRHIDREPTAHERRKDHELEDSLREFQIQPVIVRRNGTSEKYRIVVGSRRVAQCAAAGIKVLARVVDWDDDRAFKAAARENTQRRNLRPMAAAKLCADVRKRHNWQGGPYTKLVAEFVGMSSAWVTEHEKLLGLPAELQAKVDTLEITRDAAFELANLTLNIDAKRHAEIAARAEEIAKSEPVKTPKKTKETTESPAPQPAQPTQRKHVKAAIAETKAKSGPVPEQDRIRLASEWERLFSVMSTGSAIPPVMIEFSRHLLGEWRKSRPGSEEKAFALWGKIAALVADGGQRPKVAGRKDTSLKSAKNRKTGAKSRG